MRQLWIAFALATITASPVFADTAVQKDADPAHGTTAPAPGVSPPASKTVVPEIPANKKPDMETIAPSGASNGAGSGTAGTGDSPPAVDPAKPASQ